MTPSVTTVGGDSSPVKGALLASPLAGEVAREAGRRGYSPQAPLLQHNDL